MSVTATRDPLMPVIGVVTDIRIDTPDVKTFRVVTPDGKKAFEHRPGQCAMLSVPGVGEAMFSITSSPTNTEFMEFSIKKCGCVTEWLHSMEDSVDRSSLIGDAILYTLNQENYLRRYLDDGHPSIDNNSAERAIKNFAVGRRNWLFAKSIRGADASAVVYSIAETALLNGLKPYVYLSYVLDELRKMGPFPKPDDLNRLLPWSNELPEGFRTKKKK